MRKSKRQNTKEKKNRASKTFLIGKKKIKKIRIWLSDPVNTKQDDFYKTFWSTIKLRPPKFSP